MDNTKILKKQIKLLNKQIKGLEKENVELKKKRQGKNTKEVKPKAFVAHKESRLDINKVKEEIKNRDKKKFSHLKSSDSEEPMVEKFYHVAKIIAKDVETDKQKELLYDKCKLFDEIFAVLDKYVDDVIDVHVKLDEKGIPLTKSLRLSSVIKENLKVRHVDKINYNPNRLKAPQEQYLELKSPNKDHKDFDPIKAEEKLSLILEDGKLKDVIGKVQKKSELMSVYINDVEKMIPKKSYLLDELKMWLKVPLDCDLKRAINLESGRVEYSGIVQGKEIIVISGDRLITVINR